MALTAIQASLLLHLSAFAAAVAGPWLFTWYSNDRAAEFASRRGVINIQAGFLAEAVPAAAIDFQSAKLLSAVASTEHRMDIEKQSLPSSTKAENIAMEDPPPGEDGSFPPPQTLRTQHAASPTTLQREAAFAAPVLTRPVTAAPQNLRGATIAEQPAGFETTTRPSFAQNQPPEYPPLARRNGWQGTVLVRMWIDKHGVVTAAKVESSSGYSILDEAALSAIKTWRAEPARRNGLPVATEEIQPIIFRQRP